MIRPWTHYERHILEFAIGIVRGGGILGFLLARAVHRALVLDERLAEQSWIWASEAGIDLAEKVTEAVREQIDEIQGMLAREAVREAQGACPVRS